MNQPTFDSSGYPADETLDRIEHWPPEDVRGLLNFMAEAWEYPDLGPSRVDHNDPITERFREPGFEVWCAATGGWSGNEDLIRAFMRNGVAWLISWRASLAGGAYYWRVREGE